MNLKKQALDPFSFWVANFIEKHHLIESDSKRCVLLVSGGADSLALLQVFLKLEYSFSILHFHHQTRSEREHAEDIAVIKKILSVNNRDKDVELKVIKLKKVQANFEYNARQMRRDYLSKFFSDHLIVTAHHLDDSFEWWLRGKLTQSRTEFPLGIAVKNQNTIRPFLGVSKKHILQFIADEKIEFHEDSTNKNIAIERNFLRTFITSQFAKKYPKYLKHYVNRQNQVAKKLGVHILQQENKTCTQMLKLSDDLWYFSLASAEKNFEASYELHRILTKYSATDRGTIQKSLTQLFGDRNDFSKIRGPMSFSGNLHLWQWHHHFFLLKDGTRPTTENCKLDQYLQLKIAHIHNSLTFNEYPLDFMGLKIIKSTKYHSKYFKEILAFKQWAPIFSQSLKELNMKLVIRTTDV